MSETVGYGDLARMFRSAAARVRENQDLLSRLDSVGGDGDHGTTMARAMARAEEAIEAEATGQIKALIFDVGWAIMGVDGGATGPLFGTFFMSMSDAVGEADSLDAGALADAFAAGLAALEKQTSARPGDKTLMDARPFARVPRRAQVLPMPCGRQRRPPSAGPKPQKTSRHVSGEPKTSRRRASAPPTREPHPWRSSSAASPRHSAE